MTQGPEFYGLLLGSIGLGAIGGSLVLHRVKKKLGADRLVAAASLGTALSLVLLGFAHDPATALVACFIAGVTWTLILSTLYVSAQVALPDWVRGRGLAIFLTVIFGASTIGSALWGHIAGMHGLSIAHYIAAGGAVLAIPLTWRWKLLTGLDQASVDPRSELPDQPLRHRLIANRTNLGSEAIKGLSHVLLGSIRMHLGIIPPTVQSVKNQYFRGVWSESAATEESKHKTNVI